MRAEVARLVPRVPARARPVEARGAVRQLPATGRWGGSFSVAQDGFVGERQFEADACLDVAHAFALVVALALDPTIAPEPAPAPPPTRPGGGATASTAPRRTGRERASWVIGAGGRLQAGLLPGLAPGVDVEGGRRWARGRVSVGGMLLPARSDELTGLPGAEGRYGLVAGGVTGCLSWPLAGPLAIDVCGRTFWGQAWATSRGVEREGTGRALWGGVGASGGLAVGLGDRGAVRAGGEGGASVVRPSFVIENSNVRYRWPAANGGLTLGGEVYF